MQRLGNSSLPHPPRRSFVQRCIPRSMVLISLGFILLPLGPSACSFVRHVTQAFLIQSEALTHHGSAWIIPIVTGCGTNSTRPTSSLQLGSTLIPRFMGFTVTTVHRINLVRLLLPPLLLYSRSQGLIFPALPCCHLVCECCLLLGVGDAEIVRLAVVGDLRLPPLPICTHTVEARWWTRLRLLWACLRTCRARGCARPVRVLLHPPP
jgi:hypothetical protein